MLQILFLSASIYASLAADCSSTRDAGYSCSDGSPQKFFYFDARTKVCQPLFYKGCGGNENKYGTAQECRDTCLNGGNKSDTQTRPLVLKSGHDQWVHATKCDAEFLIPNGNYIACGDGCPSNHTCTGDVCCPSRNHVCSLIDETGDFKDGIEDKPRFGWSDRWNTCIRFSYYGINGNYNNFPNFNSCQRYCNPANRH